MKSDLPTLIDAYRAENPGTSLDARALRERVLAATWRRRRRRLRRAVWLFPIAAVLVGSGALAAGAPLRESVSRVLERLGVMATVTASLSPAPVRHAGVHGSGAAPLPAAPRPEAALAEASPAAPARDTTPAALTAELTASDASSESPARPGGAEPPAAAQSRLGARAAAAQRSKVELAARGSETLPGDALRDADGAADGGATTAKMVASNVLAADIATYRSAHDLHFVRADYARALAAWDDYLVHFPQGTFVPEARLNRAVCLARLGETEQARTALRALSDSTDEYTRTRARGLQAALPGVRSSP